MLTELENDKFYVIGGLVDHNSQKGLCHREATALGIQTARLPIDEFIHLNSRKVLTVNHVFEILAAVSEGKGWKEALLGTIPERKGVSAKEVGEGEGKVQDCDKEKGMVQQCDEEESLSVSFQKIYVYQISYFLVHFQIPTPSRSTSPARRSPSTTRSSSG